MVHEPNGNDVTKQVPNKEPDKPSSPKPDVSESQVFLIVLMCFSLFIIVLVLLYVNDYHFVFGQSFTEICFIFAIFCIVCTVLSYYLSIHTEQLRKRNFLLMLDTKQSLSVNVFEKRRERVFW